MKNVRQGSGDMKTNLCRGSRCCATIEFDGEFFIITDDYGGIVKLTIEELHSLNALNTKDYMGSTPSNEHE